MWLVDLEIRFIFMNVNLIGHMSLMATALVDTALEYQGGIFVLGRYILLGA